MNSMARRLGWPIALLWLLPVGRVEADVREGVERYASGESRVTLDWLAPAARGKFPAILLLHPAGGLDEGTTLLFRAIGRDFAERGYVALIPHYFERTNHTVGRPFQPKEFETMVATVGDAIDFAVASGIVDADRIGMIGISMGASVAFLWGGRDPRIKAIVSCSGSLPIGSTLKFPPVLILQGSKDRGSPLANLKRFQEDMKASGTPCANHVYKGMGHNFDLGRLTDAAERAATFFDKYVKNPRDTRPKNMSRARARKHSDPGATPGKNDGDNAPNRDAETPKGDGGGPKRRDETRKSEGAGGSEPNR